MAPLLVRLAAQRDAVEPVDEALVVQLGEAQVHGEARIHAVDLTEGASAQEEGDPVPAGGLAAVARG